MDVELIIVVNGGAYDKAKPLRKMNFQQMPPTIAVVIPLYNKRSTVRDCISAILNQTQSVTEIVVIDDGSTDESYNAITDLQDRITLIRQQNMGPSAARNVGMRCVSADWVAFCDADDYWHLDRAAAIYDFVAEFPEVDWICGGYYRVLPSGERQQAPTLPSPAPELNSVLDYRSIVAEAQALHCSDSLVVKRTSFLEIGGFNEQLCLNEITLAYLCLAMKSPQMGYMPSPTVDVHVDRTDSSYLQQLRTHISCGSSIRELAKLLGKNSTFDVHIMRMIRSTLKDALHIAGMNIHSCEVTGELIKEFGQYLTWDEKLRCTSWFRRLRHALGRN